MKLAVNRSTRRILTGCRPALHSLLQVSGFWGTVPRSSASFHINAAHSGESSSSGSTPLATQGPYNSVVKSRGVIRLEGPDVFKYLQGLVTNDVKRLERDPPEIQVATPSPTSAAAIKPPIYTAILNPQGRFLYDLFLYRPTHPIEKLDRAGSSPGRGDDGVPYLLADVDSAVLDELISHLNKHRLRAKVDIENVSSDLDVWQRFGGITADEPTASTEDEAGAIGWGSGIDKSAQTTAESNDHGWHWYKDPRLAELGLRGVFPKNRMPPLVTVDQEVAEEYYLLWRLEQGVAEGSTEIPKGEAIPLEFNLAGLNAISFDKGCYVGQELVARTHHRGVIRKRLMPVEFMNEAGEEVQQEAVPGIEVVDMTAKKKVGKVTTVLGPRGVALMRLDAALKDLSELKLDIPDKNVNVKVIRPKWWPDKWGREGQQETIANA